MSRGPVCEFLVCDAAGCGHAEAVAGGVTARMIGRPCPACGADLLTAADFALFETMRGVAGAVAAALPPPAAGAAPRAVLAQARAGALHVVVAPCGDVVPFARAAP